MQGPGGSVRDVGDANSPGSSSVIPHLSAAVLANNGRYAVAVSDTNLVAYDAEGNPTTFKRATQTFNSDNQYNAGTLGNKTDTI